MCSFMHTMPVIFFNVEIIPRYYFQFSERMMCLGNMEGGPIEGPPETLSNIMA